MVEVKMEKTKDWTLLKLLISDYVTDCKELAYHLQMDDYIESINIDTSHKTIRNKCLYILDKVDQISRERIPEEWSFWRNVLKKFEDGKQAIRKLETRNPKMFAPPHGEDDLILHENNFRENLVISHHYDIAASFKKLKINKKGREKIDISSKKISKKKQIFHREWCEERRSEWFMKYAPLFKHIKIYNEVNDCCKVLSTLKSFFISKNNNGFAVKGVNHAKNCYLFGGNGQLTKYNFENKITAIVQDKYVESTVLLHIAFANKENIREVMNDNMLTIQLIESTYECFQKGNCIHVGVVLFDETLTENDVNSICDGCFSLQLVVPSSTFQDLETLKKWYNDVIKPGDISHWKDQNKNFAFDESTIRHFKEELFSYAAIDNKNFPNFAKGIETEMHETKKLAFFSPEERNILECQKKHILVKGGFSSSKSLILQKKLGIVLKKIDKSDTVFYICHDQQSEYTVEMKEFVKANSYENVIVYNSSELNCESPRISSILNNLKNNNNGKNIHVFIEEFNALYLNAEKEINQIGEVMNYFKESYVIIGMQPMELCKSDLTKLCNLPDFKIFNLQFIFRCPVSVDKLLRHSVQYLEKKNVSFQYHEFKSNGKHLDYELGCEYSEHFNKRVSETLHCYNYNHPTHCAHAIDGPKPIVKLFPAVKVKATMNLINKSLKELYGTFKKIVITTLDKGLFNLAYQLLESNNIEGYNWVETIADFRTADCGILLVYYTALKGFEFENVLVLTPLNLQHLKFRIIEVLSRSTINLSIYIIPSSDHDRVMEELVYIWKDKNLVHWYDVQPYGDTKNNGFRFNCKQMLDCFVSCFGMSLR